MREEEHNQDTVLASQRGIGDDVYRTIVETLPLCIFHKDLSGQFTFVNRAFSELLKRERAEILGATDIDFFPAELARKYAQDDRTVIETGKTFEGLEEHHTPSGQRIYVYIIKTPMRDAAGTLLGVQGIFWDVTEAKAAADEKLRASEERFRLLVEGVRDYGLYMLDATGRVVSWNPGAERIKGYRAEEIIGKNFSCFHPSEDVRSGRPEEALRIAASEGRFEEENWRVRKDGSRFWAGVLITPLRDEGGNIRGFAKITRDISERRQLEEQLLQAQKMEAVGRLAGGVAHDFNNMLTIIKGCSELALDQLPPDSRLRELLLDIRGAGERAAELTRQLLTFSRQQVMESTLLDVNQVVANIEKLLRRLIGEDIEFVSILAPEPVGILADAGQIEQVLMNLAINARDAMPQGGKLIFETRRIELDEDYTRLHLDVRPGPYVMLTVTDTGCGMDAETQSHIFEPFFTTKEPGRGTGLGLSTVYGIIKQNGGDIWVYSEPRHGTTFKIYLPEVTEVIKEKRAVAAAVRPHKGTETVLLVEDEPTVRRLVRITLEECGYTVLEAKRGDEALRLAEQHAGPIHLLITDVVMPEVSGRVLAERLTTLRPKTKVLFMSGYTDDAVIRHGVLEAETAFIQKPFAPTSLARKVREVLGPN